MKRLPIIAFVLLFCSFSVLGQSRADTIRRHLLTPGDGTVLVAAHRGDWRNAPENSLEAAEVLLLHSLPFLTRKM